MMNPDEILKSGLFAVFAGGVISSDTDISRPLLLLDPRSVDVSVERTDSEVVLAILHTRTDESGVNITVGEGARLSIVELYLAEAFSEVRISQRASSSCRMVCAELCGANVSYRMNLEGEGAENVLRGLFVASGADHCTVNIVTNHLVGGCKSDSMVKGVAFGQATGEFRGLVYVAEDAQNTDAMQQSRNIQSGGARISAMPQLEIYADDVRCSHGATVGQIDDEAVMYMRQRGLCEEEARRLLAEGFVNDIVCRCDVEPLRRIMEERVAEKTEGLR